MNMNIPVLVLLGFTAWTLLVLFGSIGVYRWSRILTGRASLAEWRADVPQGSDWYQRAMRAHMNCVENLPLYGALVVALNATGLQSGTVDRLAVMLLAARIGQTLAHIVLPPTDAATALRFSLFVVQVVCMAAMGAVIAGALSP
jgi:uncharacterized MAPEG superfamily protein